ncbi:flagellar L-ring protein precursor FlgH [Poseidonocella sedimentorum]|uniref:Flagellar L-ring protein n=2 Tax=Poseidonocella sedimentorum TaxID=871652 RepID=A0A1I6D5U0_9RHOB|nr:flagellar basal body L-ring protein FlgH [Poseidonocella sedimentorum]SFR00687.1 flagellar L-ring protein precursor FlgH [Poseidonocella sedimentorum]
MLKTPLLIAALGLLAAGCGRMDHLGKAPSFSEPAESPEHVAMLNAGTELVAPPLRDSDNASLWDMSRHSLLGERRAVKTGDILTVVIEIDERAEISNSTSQSRSGSESLGIDQLFGLPQRANENLPEGATLGEAVAIDSSSEAAGDGRVRRNEKLTLRVAATIVDVMPNGVFAIAGSQEVRVNFEMRELLVTGYVRAADISRQNEITYDKIASARISYGGRGQITDMQQPRYGQQILDRVLPF